MRVLAAGQHALLVELDDAEATQATYHAVVSLADQDDSPPVDVVPAARTVLIDGIDPAAWRERLARLDTAGGDFGSQGKGRDVVVPLRYDGADLADVASSWGCSEDEVVRRHQETTFTVAFCGFAPGFAYCTSGGALPSVARRDQPRTKVAAGSVGLAGEYCGIYPREMPGGWQLIGTTGLTMFDPDRDEPALLRPGDRVRFEASPGIAGNAGSTRGVAARFPRNSRGNSGGRVRVVEPGPALLVQDLGRPGWAHLGVPRSGALDPEALAQANRLVGNAAEVAGLEVLLGGCVLEALTSLRVALTGAPMPLVVAGRQVGWGEPVSVRAGDRVEIRTAPSGLRSWLALAGGVQVPEVLGSRATDVLSGLGPEPLRSGDLLPVGDAPTSYAAEAHAVPADLPDAAIVLGLRLGPRQDWFTEPSLERLTTTAYQVSPDSDRVGLRLTAPERERLDRRVDTELASEGIVLGAVQVPGDGQPLVFLADHPVTGGYPVIGVVDDAGLARCAQLRPGDLVRFARLPDSRADSPATATPGR